VILKEGKLDLSSGKDKIEIVGDQSEMIYVAIEAYANLSSELPAREAAAPPFIGGNTGCNNGLYAIGAAVAPTKIGLSTPCPDDFDSFWDGKLAACRHLDGAEPDSCPQRTIAYDRIRA
jgi:hypothetical protein